MSTLKKVWKYMAAHHDSKSTQTLARLVLALESDEKFVLRDLYQLDYDTFLLALDLIKDWRLERYYTSKALLLDLTLQVTEMKH